MCNYEDIGSNITKRNRPCLMVQFSLVFFCIYYRNGLRIKCIKFNKKLKLKCNVSPGTSKFLQNQIFDDIDNKFTQPFFFLFFHCKLLKFEILDVASQTIITCILMVPYINLVYRPTIGDFEKSI